MYRLYPIADGADIRLWYRDKQGRRCMVRGKYKGVTPGGQVRVWQSEHIKWWIPQSQVIEIKEVGE